jgi:8-oxo-dGTP diphosphatase
VLEAYAVSRIATSSSTRCVDTVLPYAEHSGWPMSATGALSEEDATDAGVLDIVDDLVTSGEDAVLCTHRPVLPAVYDALGIAREHHRTGELVVVHHRDGRVRAIERHGG